ncbi:RNA-binding cell elongation regulator Jag/EloR [Aquibacillus rhizosphaerae]|uniref:RNA-binding protein KhpB n=1 Tax=Aquibacillus rhizosphaerae TaxID=3051431 RepID=A0ABT7L4Y5_9BACI|nr:RNA-binding cell elongation regulator Jag/EloR [Aquibacillus sp. LR5S19]MDL4840930.1 RNA-binding cell elongation regulator Jag/EloR [Aquibacillus sp. LR5S19]
MKQVTASGQTVEDAVQSALKQLNTTEDQVKVEVIDEGKKGIFGLFGSKPAIVKVMVVDNHLLKAEKYIKEITTQLGVDAKVEKLVSGNEITFQLSGEKIAILIGKRGQTLNAIQYLLHLVINKNSNQYYTVVVDAEGYRKRREETLINLADRLAEKAVRSKREVSLEPMPSYERKIIHTALQDKKNIKTYSFGNEPNRHVVIKP